MTALSEGPGCGARCAHGKKFDADPSKSTMQKASKYPRNFPIGDRFRFSGNRRFVQSARAHQGDHFIHCQIVGGECGRIQA
jgi:hypothetical protein